MSKGHKTMKSVLQVASMFQSFPLSWPINAQMKSCKLNCKFLFVTFLSGSDFRWAVKLGLSPPIAKPEIFSLVSGSLTDVNMLAPFPLTFVTRCSICLLFNHLISLTVFCQYFLPAPDYGFVSHYRCVNFDVLFCRKTFSSYWNCAQQLSIWKVLFICNYRLWINGGCHIKRVENLGTFWKHLTLCFFHRLLSFLLYKFICRVLIITTLD